MSSSVAVQIEQEIHQAYEQLSKLSDKPISHYSSQVLDKLSHEIWKLEGIKAANQQIQEGKTVPLEAVEKWITSWGNESPLPKPCYTDYQ